MKIEKIREIAEIMKDNELVEVEVEQEGTRVTLRKKGGNVVEQIVSQSPAAGPQSMPAPAPAAAPADQPAPPPGLKEIKSPMVGTFYRSPTPESESYVELGSVVKKGDVLCIVEAMKLMNEVKAEFGGKIVEIKVENAEPVEFGQVMFLVEPV